MFDLGYFPINGSIKFCDRMIKFCLGCSGGGCVVLGCSGGWMMVGGFVCETMRAKKKARMRGKEMK